MNIIYEKYEEELKLIAGDECYKKIEHLLHHMKQIAYFKGVNDGIKQVLEDDNYE